MSEPDAFDVIVIGGGPVGENVAGYAAAGGLSCALVEGELLGGECSYYACMPSKALLRPVDVLTARAGLDGLSGKLEVDRAGLLARRDYWVANYDDSGQVEWAESAGITVIRGRGRLHAARTVRVSEGSRDGTAATSRTLTARTAVVLATGSTAAIPPNWRASRPWTSRDATGVREVPESLLIIGGGVVACEAARWMAALGSKVTMVVRSRLLGRFEPFVGDMVGQGLREAGVDIRLDTSVDELTRDTPVSTGLGRIHGGTISARIGAEGITATECLVAIGRHPVIDDLGLETVDLSEVTGDLPDWLHAVGDVGGGPQLTHWGKYRARILGDRLAALAAGRTPEPEPENVPVPQVVFSDPQVASVGLTKADAESAGRAVDVIDVPISSAPGAGLLRDDPIGQARLVLTTADRPGDRRVIGATFVGPEVGELIHSATVAILGELPLSLLWHAVPSYPTVSEIWLKLVEEARSTLPQRSGQIPPQ